MAHSRYGATARGVVKEKWVESSESSDGSKEEDANHIAGEGGYEQTRPCGSRETVFKEQKAVGRVINGEVCRR